MNRVRTLLLLATLLTVCAGVAQADPIDPVIIVRGGTGSINLTSLAPIPINFGGTAGCLPPGPYPQGTFPPNPAYVGLPSLTCVFNNMTNLSIYTLTFNISSVQPLTLLCGVLCTTTPAVSGNGLVATFSFNPPIPGLPASINLREFAIDFINFNTGTTFTATLATPEPGTLALFGTGLSALALGLKKRLKKS